MPVPFRQRRYFYYLTGFNEPDAYVTYDTRRDELVLYIRPLNPKEVLWSGMPPSIPECLARYGGSIMHLSVPPLTDTIQVQR